ncbi:hypothetical protein BURPS1655_B0113 [Burkholderia pseudomallei 1655]|nr:hypothetical protein BURPS1655_B0113 [Burkholderia pseudomallei 1655]
MARSWLLLLTQTLEIRETKRRTSLKPLFFKDYRLGPE